MMPQRKDYDVPYPNILLEIDKSTKEYMTTQFEHNKYFTEELKEHSVVLEAITKQPDDISREICNLQSKYAFAESLLGKISDAQATLVNQMAAKPISFEDNNDEDLKMIGVSSIDSLFSKLKIDDKETEEESTLGRRRPNISEGENLVEKIDESGFGEVKTLASDAPNLLDYKDFSYDSCSLIDCISLLQSMINSPHAYEQNKAFTKHIVDAMMKALEEKLELEVSIPRKLHDEWEPAIKVKIKYYECFALCDLGASVSTISKS